MERSQRASLFPLAWAAYPLDSWPIVLESVSFSPLLPGDAPERSLPLHLVVFRAHNPTDELLEAALMLTWACGWPEMVPDAAFDFQHDNLCLTGSLGSPGSPNRQGIAVPDLHYMGIYEQGIEPWTVPAEESEIVDDFAEQGELDPRVVRSTPHGAAAWVKFDLEPGETKETPFVLAWHFPQYTVGPAAGHWRTYTQHLGRHRPDNAIVWLAEQAVQHYGAQVANYRHWLQQIRDWHEELGPRVRDVCDALEAVISASTVWPQDGSITTVETVGPAHLELAKSVWPELRTG
jgi:non-lysosomal glucosylceramidase